MPPRPADLWSSPPGRSSASARHRPLQLRDRAVARTDQVRSSDGTAMESGRAREWSTRRAQPRITANSLPPPAPGFQTQEPACGCPRDPAAPTGRRPGAQQDRVSFCVCYHLWSREAPSSGALPLVQVWSARARFPQSLGDQPCTTADHMSTASVWRLIVPPRPCVSL